MIRRTLIAAASLAAVTAAFVSLIANAASGPPYGNGPSVFVPFTNAPLPSDTQPTIKVGFASPNATSKKSTLTATMDTGSIGIIAGSNYFAPPAAGTSDPSFVAAGTETLTSSGYKISGDWYQATVYLYNGTTIVARSSVPVMAVTNISCLPDSRVCNPNNLPNPADTVYFGVGFGGGAGSPQGTPDKNAFLNVTTPPGMSPGYVLSAQGVQIGLNASNT